MKKDSNLEREFDEYFEAGKAPDIGVTDAAKNLIRRPERRANTALRRTLIAAACAASVFVSGVGFYFFPTMAGSIADTINGFNQANNGTPPAVNDGEKTYYGTETLAEAAIDFYTDLPAGLDFVKKLDAATNYSVNSVDGYYAEGELTFVKAEFSAIVNASRHDTVVYAEYTEQNTVCELFEEYYGGEAAYYGGKSYLCFETEENGEPCKKLTVVQGDIKYYVAVTSTDENAYRVWLDIILK